MQKDTIIYVTDQRQKYLADMLGGEQTDCRNSGGCDFEACKRYQINCTHALGLPGIYCPKTGAKILYDCMKRKGMTEGLWLFRIAP